MSAGSLTGMGYGLPDNYRNEDESWDTFCGYLDAIAHSGSAVETIAAAGERSGSSFAAHGLLEVLNGKGWLEAQREPGVTFVLNEADTGSRTAFITIKKRSVTNVSLATEDGDYLFTLTVRMGEFSLAIRDDVRWS